MDKQDFDVEVERSIGLISAAADRFWTLATLERFKARILAEQEAVRRSGLRPLLLIDVRRHGVQSKEVVQGLQEYANSAHGRATRTAVVVEAALYRPQADRIRSSSHHALFRDMREARDWLVTGEEIAGRESSLSVA